MNIEEAKANIGAEVVLLEDTKPYSNSKYADLAKNYDLFGLSVGNILSVNDIGDALVKFECEDENTAVTGKYIDFHLNISVGHIAIKQTTFKAGDQVVLDESTRPYTYGKKNRNADKEYNKYIGKTLTVIEVDNMGAEFKAPCGELDIINPCHLKLAPQQEVKLPSGILDGLKNDLDTSTRKMNSDQLKKIGNDHYHQDVKLPEFKVKEVKPSTNPYLKDVTDLLQSLDVSFVVKEDDLAFTVVYADNEERISKSCVRSLSWAYGLVIAEEAGKESEFIEMYGKLVECSTLLRKAGHEVKTTMRGIEVL